MFIILMGVDCWLEYVYCNEDGMFKVFDNVLLCWEWCLYVVFDISWLLVYDDYWSIVNIIIGFLVKIVIVILDYNVECFYSVWILIVIYC